MKQKSKSVNRTRIVLAVVSAVVILLLFFAVDSISNKPAIRAYCQNTQEFIDTNQASLSTLFTTVFDSAKECRGNTKCESEVSSSIFSSLYGLEGLGYKESTYFIRLNDENTIEKLFLSGKYTSVRNPQAKEKKVIALLKNERGAICDEGWKIDGNELEEGFSGSRMRYLYDMFSEAEILIPVLHDDRVIGVVVKAWGD